jgi:hypothetical protein
MRRHRKRLLALAATGAALAGLTTTPPEATVAACIYTDGTTSEGRVAENADLSAPQLASGCTDAHRG